MVIRWEIDCHETKYNRIVIHYILKYLQFRFGPNILLPIVVFYNDLIR